MHDQITSDMITSMELERARPTPVLTERDLDIVLEALGKPPYKPLREVSLKHLTYKLGFSWPWSQLEDMVNLMLWRVILNTVQTQG